MRIGFITRSSTSDGGGVAEVVIQLADALAKRKHELFVFSVGSPSRSVDGSVEVSVVRGFGRASFGYSRTLLREILKADIDVLHLHGLWTYCSIASRAWAKETGKPLIISPHGMLDTGAMQYSKWKKRAYFWLIERRCLSSAVFIHTLCEAESNTVSAVGKDLNIVIVKNGVPLVEGLPPAASPTWATVCPEDTKFCLYLGRIHPKKNLGSLISAWQSLSGAVEREGWALVIAGWGDEQYVRHLRSRVESEAISNVVFAGCQFGDDKSATFLAASCFILPSLSEGLPLAVLEAWAYGLPVIMSRECNIPEGFVANAAIECGVTPESIGEALLEFLRLDVAARFRVASAGKKLVFDSFSWQKISVAFERLYSAATSNSLRDDG